MKDYRTWWIRGVDVWEELTVCYFHTTTKCTVNEKDGINRELMKVQCWAIREGLA